jgi:hypothetical protein
MSEALAWLFDKLELELDQDFRHNYLKVSFVHLNPLEGAEDMGEGRLSTNFPELPDNMQVPAEMLLRQMIKAIRSFLSHMRAAVEIGGFDWETFSCDWVSMTFNKSPSDLRSESL